MAPPGNGHSRFSKIKRRAADVLIGEVGGVDGLQSADDFHQRHHGHRVEEVHSDEALWPVELHLNLTRGSGLNANQQCSRIMLGMI